MTPTLYGRWQTRVLLLSTIGFLISIGFISFTEMDFTTVLAVLLYVICFGIGWDVLYNYLHARRWDYDWPPYYQLLAGIWEAIFLWLLISPMRFWQMMGLDSLPGVSPELEFGQFISHYSTVWIVTFLASQGLLRIIFPRWRYNGGEWL